MSKQSNSPSKRRRPLNRELVVQTAMKIADNEGLEALSMRRLGHELDVEAMALYHHFKNKDQLIEDMLNTVHAEIAVPADETDWKLFMRRRAESVIEVLSRHPWAATIMESGVNPGPATMQDRESIIRCFREAGFSIEATVHAITVLDVYVYGATQQYVKLSFSTAEQAAEVSESVIEKFPAAYPYFSEILTQHILTGKYRPIDEFHFGLNLVLDGIARLQHEDWLIK